ncbi:hypothetical protein [Vibrio harveyi]|uniref:hypothetical protein n=1 Tax=Vibrio harveyi TaxID=669 RepID=UPI0025B09E27|nr:hypothetical protein [Vibrio harveyi]WJT10976.1 hypothetical protein PH545_28685 [Vibrio harveyi]
MIFDISSALQCLRTLVKEGTKKEGWIAVCLEGSRYYFVDATNNGLTTCISNNLMFDDYESATASLAGKPNSEKMYFQISA